ncbi:MAG: hypothetical protein ACE37F_00040 [Nannocystaceae bacterium]|nr:hypothetical protein [bacterium]
MKLLGVALIVSTLAVTAGCAGHEEGKGKSPPNGPEVATATPEEPQPQTPPSSAKVQIAVSSVQLQDDCPSPKSASASPVPVGIEEPGMQQKAQMGDAPAHGARAFAPSCVQSRVQFSIESESDQAHAFAVKAVRLKKAEGGEVVGTMTTREPTVWEESKYNPWDQKVAAGASLRVGYALGAPDWGKVEKALGQSTWGPMYVVEFDVEIGGEVRTLVSPQAPRDEPENIVT